MHKVGGVEGQKGGRERILSRFHTQHGA